MTNQQLQAVESLVKEAFGKFGDAWLHGFDHAQKVRRNSVDLVKKLKLDDKLDINLIQAAALLHDLHYASHIPSIGSYFLESRLVKRTLVPVLNKLDITDKEKSIILSACINHPHSFPFRRLNRQGDYYGQILQDADTLDFFDEMRMRQYLIENRHKGRGRLLLSYFFWRWGKLRMGKFLNHPDGVKVILNDKMAKQGSAINAKTR